MPGFHEQSDHVEGAEIAHDTNGDCEDKFRNRIHLCLLRFLNFIDYIIFL